ncbi:MAG: hypothetical protein HYX74_08740 [Acidobacteria bacterium]|nr:hypothetical protein [Acidobacteriota bacterium]
MNGKGEALNVSTGIGTSVRDLAQKVAALGDGSVETVYEPIQPGQESSLVQGRVRLPSELQTMILSRGRAGELFGWKPEVDFQEGIREELHWLRDHADRWTRFKV